MKYLALLILGAGIASGQSATSSAVIMVSSDPTGVACVTNTSKARLYHSILYICQSNAFAVASGGGGGSGTVSSFSVAAVPSWISSSVATSTTTPALTLSAGTGKTANFIVGTDGSGNVGLMSLTGAQLPNPSATTLGGIQSKAAVSHQFLTSISTSGVPALAQPAFTDISGTATGAQLPNPSASTLGGVQSKVAVANNFLTGISTSGVPTLAQPAFSDISGVATTAQLPSLSSGSSIQKANGSGLFTAAGSADVVSLFGSGSCSGFLKSDGTCAASGSGTVTHTAGALTTGQVVIGNGSADVKVDTGIDDGVTTVNTLTYSGTGGIAAASFSTNASTPGSMSVVAGTGSIATLPSSSAGFAAPASGGTSYLLKLPATITAGIPAFATPGTNDGVNESAVSVKSLQGTDSKILTAGTVSGTAATLCTDANGGATTSGCSGGGSTPVPFYQNVELSSGGVSLTGAGQIRLIDYNITTPVTFGTIMWSLNVNDTSSCSAGANCYDVGIYTTAGALVAHTGAISLTSGVFSAAISGGGTVTMQPGRYIFAFTGSGTTARLGAGGSASYFTGQYFSVPSQTSTSGVLPSTITVPADSWSMNSNTSFLGLRQ